jgi:hypothetical protein
MSHEVRQARMSSQRKRTNCSPALRFPIVSIRKAMRHSSRQWNSSALVAPRARAIQPEGAKPEVLEGTSGRPPVRVMSATTTFRAAAGPRHESELRPAGDPPPAGASDLAAGDHGSSRIASRALARAQASSVAFGSSAAAHSSTASRSLSRRVSAASTSVSLSSSTSRCSFSREVTHPPYRRRPAPSGRSPLGAAVSRGPLRPALG